MIVSIALAFLLQGDIPQVTEYLVGAARITLEDGRTLYAAGSDRTYRWQDGREVVLISLSWLPDQAPQPRYINLADALVTCSARPDGSELIEIQGYGRIELFTTDSQARDVFKQHAGESESHRSSVRFLLREGGIVDIVIQAID